MTIREETVQELSSEKMEGQGGTRQKSTRSRRCRKNDDGTEFCQLADIILVMALTSDLGILLLATIEFGRNA